MDKKINIQFYIKDISTLEFSVKNLQLNLTELKENLIFKVTPSFSLDVVSKVVDINTLIGIYFDKKKQNRICELLTSIKFGVKNIDSFIDKKDDNLVNLPDQFIQTLISISLSTSRGILAAKTEGTILNGIYLPVLNPSKFKPVIKTK